MYDIGLPAVATRASEWHRWAMAWRRALCRLLVVEEAEFQLMPGLAGPVMSGDDGLSLVADLVPDPGPVAHYDTTFASRRSHMYRRLLLSLLPETETGLRGVLGASYDNWIVHRLGDRSGRSQARLFAVWARRRFDTVRAQAAMRAFAEAQRDPVAMALEACDPARGDRPFVHRDGHIDSLARYAVDRVSVMQALRIGRDAVLDGAETAGATLRGHIGAAAFVPLQPGPWYDPEVVDRAWLAGDDPMVWQHAVADGWDRFFGVHGSLSRHISRLLVVSDCDLTMDVPRPSVALSAPGWPALYGGARTSQWQLSGPGPAGKLRFRLRVPKSGFQIWGGLVADTPH